MSAVSFTPEAEHIAEIRRQLRRFLAKNAPPERCREWDREHRWPRDLFAEIAAMGLIGLTIPEQYGGSGQDLVAAVAVIEELSLAGAFLSGPYIHAAFYGGMNLSENGSEAQKAELLPRIAAGWPGNSRRLPVLVTLVPSTFRIETSPSTKLPMYR